MRKMIDHLEAAALRATVHAVDEIEIDVVDRRTVLVAIDQVNRCAADPLDRRQSKLHRPGRDLHGLCAFFQRQVVGRVCVPHAKGHAACTGPVFAGEIPGLALRLGVDDEIDIALAPERNVF
jgi:hypothetical protein